MGASRHTMHGRPTLPAVHEFIWGYDKDRVAHSRFTTLRAARDLLQDATGVCSTRAITARVVDRVGLLNAAVSSAFDNHNKGPEGPEESESCAPLWAVLADALGVLGRWHRLKSSPSAFAEGVVLCIVRCTMKALASLDLGPTLTSQERAECVTVVTAVLQACGTMLREAPKPGHRRLPDTKVEIAAEAMLCAKVAVHWVQDAQLFALVRDHEPLHTTVCRLLEKVHRWMSCVHGHHVPCVAALDELAWVEVMCGRYRKQAATDALLARVLKHLKERQYNMFGKAPPTTSWLVWATGGSGPGRLCSPTSCTCSLPRRRTKMQLMYLCSCPDPYEDYMRSCPDACVDGMLAECLRICPMTALDLLHGHIMALGNVGLHTSDATFKAALLPILNLLYLEARAREGASPPSGHVTPEAIAESFVFETVLRCLGTWLRTSPCVAGCRQYGYPSSYVASKDWSVQDILGLVGNLLVYTPGRLQVKVSSLLEGALGTYAHSHGWPGCVASDPEIDGVHQQLEEARAPGAHQWSRARRTWLARIAAVIRWKETQPQPQPQTEHPCKM